MILSKPVKILIGIGTAWLILYPLMFIIGWFSMMSGMMSGAMMDSPNFFPFSAFSAIFPLHCLTMIVQTALMVFYLIHIIKNKTASEVLRIILGIGIFFMPYLAMPFYYFVFIWLDQPPDWALQKESVPEIETPVAESNPPEIAEKRPSAPLPATTKSNSNSTKKLFIVLGVIAIILLLLGTLFAFVMYRTITSFNQTLTENLFPMESPTIYETLPLYPDSTPPYYQPVELGAFTEINHFKDISMWSDFNQTPILIIEDAIIIAGEIDPPQNSWRINSDLISADINTGTVNWQALTSTNSLLTDSERIYVGAPNRFGAAGVLAYDAMSGETIWETQFDDPLLAAGIGTMTIQDSDLLVETTNHGPQAVYTLNRETGEIKEENTETGLYWRDEQVSYGDLVLEKRGYGLPDGVVARHPDDSIAWQFDGRVVSNIAVGGSITYFLTDAVKLVAVNTETGAEIETLSLAPRFTHDFDFVNTSIIVAADEDVVAIYFEDSQQLSVFRMQQ